MSTSPRIIVVAPSLEILGGQGVQAALLVDALRRDGADASLLPINPGFPRGFGWLRRLPYARTVVNQALYVPSLVRLARADIVHVFSASYWSFLLAPVPAMLAARLMGRRVVLHYHSGEAADHLAHWGALVHPGLKLAHEIVVPSEYLQTTFAEHGYDARVIRNIVDLSQFRFRTRSPLRPRLLSTRNLEAYYRVDVVLDAFALVRARIPEATLTVAGYGREEQALRARAERLGLRGAVRFVGRVEPTAMPRLFEDADIFLNASVLDNQPVSILEAFAAGTPVVTTPVGDIPTMVSDGVTGRLVPVRDPSSMADAVCELLANPDAARGLAARAAETLQRFQWPAVSGQWSSVYQGGPELAAA